jgi:hypothetical protein
MVVQSAALLNRSEMGAAIMADTLTPRQVFCAPLLSALLFGGGTAGIADIYAHIRDIVTLNARDWESNPLERRLARWHTALAMAISDFVKIGVIRESGHAKWGITDKGLAVAREFELTNADGVLIERATLRKQVDYFALEFEKMYIVLRRPQPVPERNLEQENADKVNAANAAALEAKNASADAHNAAFEAANAGGASKPAPVSRDNGKANGAPREKPAGTPSASGERVQWEDLVES